MCIRDSAAKDASGKLWLEITNLDPEESVEIEAELAGIQVKSAAGEMLTAPEVDSCLLYTSRCV